MTADDAHCGSREVSITLIFVGWGRQIVRELRVPAGTTVGQALASSGLLQEIPLADSPGLASHGRRIAAASEVLEGQRIEILLPLLMTPAEARRALANRKPELMGRAARPNRA
jgi:putative ubiquitin-RnfH superfamily antitoxin RatB of RatAB toxin-antitoxin module